MADTAVEPPPSEVHKKQNLPESAAAQTESTSQKDPDHTSSAENDSPALATGESKKAEAPDAKRSEPKDYNQVGRDWNNRSNSRDNRNKLTGHQVDRQFRKGNDTRLGGKRFSGNRSKLTMNEPSNDPVQIRKQV